MLYIAGFRRVLYDKGSSSRRNAWWEESHAWVLVVNQARWCRCHSHLLCHSCSSSTLCWAVLSSVVEPFSSSSRWKWGCENREKRDVQFESFPLCTRKVWTSWVEVNRWEMPLCFPGMLWSFCCDLYVGSTFCSQRHKLLTGSFSLGAFQDGCIDSGSFHNFLSQRNLWDIYSTWDSHS